MFGYKPHYTTITCAYVQDTEFRGLWKFLSIQHNSDYY
jgi:hypothetical protein